MHQFLSYLHETLLADFHIFYYWDLLLMLFKVAVFAGGVDTSATETKGTVLIHSAEQV